MILAGSHSVDITPNRSVDLNGYIRRFGKSNGIHDSLLANFLYVESNNTKTLLVSLDILTISLETSDYLRDEISKLLNINREAIILAAIHTHSAVGAPYLRNVGSEDEDWLKDFKKKIIDGSKTAFENRKESELFSYYASSSVGVNRRNSMRGIDTNAPFVVVKQNSKIIAWLINYNCHAVCLTETNLMISADYVHYMRNCLYDNLSNQFPVIFFNGGSGDIDPKLRGSFEDAKAIGEGLAKELLLIYKVYDGKKVSENISCEEVKMTIPYTWQPTIVEAEDNLKEYKQKLNDSKDNIEKKINTAFFLWASEVVAKVKDKSLPSSLEINVTLVKLGEILFVSIPLEIFSSISLRLRKYFGKYFLFVVSYGNGYKGYLADKSAHYEGGYEIEDWHKYAGILPKDSNCEDIFFETIKKFKIVRGE
jgi:hypothetical protein